MTTIGLWSAWCVAAVAVAAVLTRRLIAWTAERGVVDVPNSRSSHVRHTPRGGGIAIVAVVAAAAAASVVLRPQGGLRMLGCLVPALVVAGVSWLDDLHSLRNRTRLAAQLAAAVAATAVLGPVSSVDLGAWGVLRFGAAAWPLTILWIVGLANAFNFMDGIDGIAGITALAAGGGVAAAAAALGSGPVALTAAALAGAALGFLTSNWQPARIFMGDVGSAFCGFLLAVLPLALPSDCVPVVLPVVALAVWPFVFDTAFTILRRARRGENVFQAHRSHLYQRLVIAGWAHRHVACLYGGMAACGAAVALAGVCDPALRGAAEPVAAAIAVVEAVALLATVAVAERRPVTAPLRVHQP